MPRNPTGKFWSRKLTSPLVVVRGKPLATLSDAAHFIRSRNNPGGWSQVRRTVNYAALTGDAKDIASATRELRLTLRREFLIVN